MRLGSRLIYVWSTQRLLLCCLLCLLATANVSSLKDSSASRITEQELNLMRSPTPGQGDTATERVLQKILPRRKEEAAPVNSEADLPPPAPAPALAEVQPEITRLGPTGVVAVSSPDDIPITAPVVAPTDDSSTATPPVVAVLPTAVLNDASSTAPSTSPTTAPSFAPSAVKTSAAPSTPPTPQQPTDGDDDDVDACGRAATCSECKTLAVSLAGEEDSTDTCWWESDACVVVPQTLHEGKGITCPEDVPLPPPSNPVAKSATKPPTKPPTKSPINSPIKPPVLDNNTDRADDGGLSSPMIIFGLVVIVVIVLAVRKVLSSTNGVANVTGGSRAHGKYHGVTTLSEDDDDEEWGWDDAPKSSVQMTSMGGGPQRAVKSRGSPLQQRRGISPHDIRTGGLASAPRSGNSVGGMAPAPDLSERKGFSVKATGMKNPLHAAPQQQQQPSVAQTQRQSLVLPKKVAKADDFFAEMGLAAKPKFGAPASTASRATSLKSLGAKALPIDDDDLGEGADWVDDGDLDDLLDD